MSDDSERPAYGEVWIAPEPYDTVWRWGNGGRWERGGCFVGGDRRTRAQLRQGGWMRVDEWDRWRHETCEMGGIACDCGPCLGQAARLRDDRIRAEARRETLMDAIAALRKERDHWYQVATCDPPGPTMRERALAKVDGITGAIARIEALMPKEETT